jgi:hypothetical protein
VTATVRMTASDFVSYHRPTRCDLRVFLRHQQEQEAEPGPYEVSCVGLVSGTREIIWRHSELSPM